jgi:predicted ester cyclase
MGNTATKVHGNREVVQELYKKAISPETHNKIKNSAFSAECIEAFTRFFGAVCDSLVKCELTIEFMVVKNDRVMVRYKLKGVPTREFMGISATGQAITVSSLDVFRLNDGKVIEHWDTVYQIAALRII